VCPHRSLSALGDVISALSNNEKFIPYRNNKVMRAPLSMPCWQYVFCCPYRYNQGHMYMLPRQTTVTKLPYSPIFVRGTACVRVCVSIGGHSSRS
jgi:hypothetical protein